MTGKGDQRGHFHTSYISWMPGEVMISWLSLSFFSLSESEAEEMLYGLKLDLIDINNLQYDFITGLTL